MFLKSVIGAVVAVSFCLSSLSSARAEETQALDHFIWKEDKATGRQLASSRSEASLNFFDVGDLSGSSVYVVQQDVSRIAAAAGLTLDRSPGKNSTIAIVHDTKVFSRLKNDKASFGILGFSPEIIEMLERRTPEGAKCVTMTLSDGQNNVVTTIVLLSEKHDGCLVRALLDSFGVAAADIDAPALFDVCVLYEGRRSGLRDREGLSREFPRLRDGCLDRAGITK